VTTPERMAAWRESRKFGTDSPHEPTDEFVVQAFAEGARSLWPDGRDPGWHVTFRRWVAAREAAADQRGREAALREAADDQSWWLTEAMDGDFLLVDCGHIGHNDGRVGISDVRPSDLTRWVAEHLRERADREAS
jgi:hypothetical protein